MPPSSPSSETIEQRANDALVDKLYKIMGQQCSLKHSMPNITRDRQLVIFVLTDRGNQLQYTSYELQKDVEVVVTAITNDKRAVRYVSDKSLLCHPAVIRALAGNVVSSPLKFLRRILAKEFPSDDRISVAKKYTMSKIARIVYYSTHLKNDERFMRFAVSVNGLALEFAGHKIRDNTEITTIASMQNPLSLKYASSRVQKEFGLLDIIGRYDSSLFGSGGWNECEGGIGTNGVEREDGIGVFGKILARKKTW